MFPLYQFQGRGYAARKFVFGCQFGKKCENLEQCFQSSWENITKARNPEGRYLKQLCKVWLMQMQTSAFNKHQLFYFWAVFSNRMGVMAHRWGKTPILHLCKILHFIPQRETLRSCDALCVERTLNGLSDHAFKVPKRTIINQMCAIER